MTRAVLDTNIVISSVFWEGKPYEVVDRLRNKFQFPEDNIQQLVDILLTYSHLVETTSKFDVVRDKKDNKILECAFDGKADYIVTGDQDLLEMKEQTKLEGFF